MWKSVRECHLIYVPPELRSGGRKEVWSLKLRAMIDYTVPAAIAPARILLAHDETRPESEAECPARDESTRARCAAGEDVKPGEGFAFGECGIEEAFRKTLPNESHQPLAFFLL